MPSVAFTLFYEGRRKCLGYNVADLNLRLLFGNMIKRFDLVMDEARPIKFGFAALWEVTNPMVKLRLRQVWSLVVLGFILF
jgi:cytochrome P450